MSFILNIDTALETAGVSIARDGMIISFQTNDIQKEHAGFLHDAIQKTINIAKIQLHELDAIAVTEGPGSYTGLRVGMATAKGLCYALQKPLVTVGMLPAMARSAVDSVQQTDALYCPMIDARRLEVYTAVYDNKLETILPPTAMVLHENSFAEILNDKKIIFFGNGSLKFKSIVDSRNAEFVDQVNVIHAVAQSSFEKLKNNILADLVYTEPLYIKEFFSP